MPATIYQKQTNQNGDFISILRTTDGACIPLAVGNRDYQEYLAWVAAGNTPADPPPPPVFVPQSVTRFQAKAALLNAGYLDQVEALMSADNTPAMYKLAWVEALNFERGAQTVAAMQAALGLTDAQIDALFIAASKISA